MDWALFSLVVVTGALAATGAGLLVRGAGAPIPLGLAALVAGAAAAIVAWRWQADSQPGWWLSVTWLVTVLAVPLALADLRHRRLPDVLTLPAYPLFAAALAGGGSPETLAAALTGTVLFGGAHLLVHYLAPGHLGAGDVKLTGSLGAVLGVVGGPALLFAAVAASVLSAALTAASRLPVVGLRLRGTPHPADGSTRRPARAPVVESPETPAAGTRSAAEPPRIGNVSATSTPMAAQSEAAPSRVAEPPHGAETAPAPVTNPPPPRPEREPPPPCSWPRIPHGPALLLTTWVCAVAGGPGSGVAMS
ncbi:A24 family peptidase [Amycolatopsis sp. PS_44_ISF1]|uniref:A24 family peptidase n=1 Tax=Amycolatopsis sp. PS_44_ISF1 TaxID=2974917 RepID=UPI0028E059BD|nr:A24 family peptidase [Amycolatopsis sp. PS_44_ISF1]MDT8914015.1 A24 family peptidase [Amycolatopsis sp. PS_44_ISF1]